VSIMGATLLSVGLTIDPDARGTYEIAVLPDSSTKDYFGAGWADANFSEHMFVGTSCDGPPVVIGFVSIIPEPSGVILLLSAALAIGVRMRLGIKRRRS
jgi:hypothetical protein